MTKALVISIDPNNVAWNVGSSIGCDRLAGKVELTTENAKTTTVIKMRRLGTHPFFQLCVKSVHS